MARIHCLQIKNFRGIKNFKHTFSGSGFTCLIGRGDAGKSTILESISYVLSPRWNLTFFDSDFYKCDTNNSIGIEATLTGLSESLIRDSKFGLHIRGIEKSTGVIKDELEDDHEVALSIKLEIKKDLEPRWYVVNSRQDTPLSISASDRAKLNVFMISDYVDRHFSWTKGNPLYSLLKQQQGPGDSEEDNIIIEVLREAKTRIDADSFQHFQETTKTVISKANELGIDISNASTSIDFKDISVRGDRVCFHDANIPFRLKGKGSKRLISIAIQTALAENGGIVLIDDIEQGLEPDRVQHLTNSLKRNNVGQVFIATHSRDVLVELKASDIFRMKKNASELIPMRGSLQGCLRKNPEAFFSEKVVVCEGSTEIGICHALNDYRIQKDKKNAAFLGVRFADGTGSNIIDYCQGFEKSGYQVCLFSDSDDNGINDKKDDLRTAGIGVFDCEQGNAIENQVFKDLPWNAIKELIAYVEAEFPGTSIRECVNSRCQESLTTNWQEIDSVAKREALGETAKARSSPWFKRIDRGKFLGTVLFKYFDQIQDKALKLQLENLSNWVDNV